jgi:glycosyltransferase involved in cell wall biosynthesis
VSATPHLLINGLSIGTGGGYTVGRELFRHLAMARPEWRVTIALIEGHPLQVQMRSEQLPENCHLHFAPPDTLNRFRRGRYESRGLVDWARGNGVTRVLQLNGMMPVGLLPAEIPTLCHFQDPWPHRREAWDSVKDSLVAMLKRRGQKHGIVHADACGWTSHYLEDLICGNLRVRPKRSEVYYNGVPDSWLARARHPGGTRLPPLDSRPMEIATVSNVSPYKRQSLVIRALARLVKMPGIEELSYRVIGDCSDAYAAELRTLAESLGVADRVFLEGRVSDERVQEALASARAMPLLSVCESFGIPLVEAMTFGTPVVIADCCALPEVCGEAAVRCPPDDLDALVDGLSRVLTDGELAEKLRIAGAERAQHFSWSKTAEKMAARLEDL